MGSSQNTIESWGSSQNKLIGNKTIASVGHNAIVVLFDCKYKVKRINGGRIIYQKSFLYDKVSFIDICEKTKNGIILYKSVNPTTNCDFYTGKIKYEVGKSIVCPDWVSDKTLQCGHGLHLSPSPELAKSYNDGKILKCEVTHKDFVVFASDATKVRCKKVNVLEELK